ncbi:MAG TPA: helix-turn-helix transcriptional regulator [Vicinamibacterales bacterium]|nr:helix-turn-helix transcriptional regulator [Vicinamibacterales bacterium]
MGRGGYLGEFEQIVLLAVARRERETYGMEIRREIEERTGRQVSIGAVYATLDRLEGKGFVQPRHDAEAGRARRFFTLTPDGIVALEASRDIQARMWSGLKLKGAGRKS